MRKKIIQGGICLFALFLILLIFVKFNPPLVSNALTWNPNDNTFVLIEVQNFGFLDVEVKQVLVNDNEIPKKVELGISRSNHLVTGGELENNPDITFHTIDDQKIHPQLSDKEQKELNNNSEKIRHYGIRIEHTKPIKQITVKYSYLLIPFTMKKEFDI